MSQSFALRGRVLNGHDPETDIEGIAVEGAVCWVEVFTARISFLTTAFCSVLTEHMAYTNRLVFTVRKHREI